MKPQSPRIMMFVLIGVLFLSVSFVYAETILLKSGKSVEGKLLEKTGKYIKIDFQGVPLTYFFDEIESIDGVKQASSSARETDLPQKNNSPYRLETAKHDSGVEYYNKEYGIKIQHPKEWKVFDRNIHPKVFKAFLANKSPDNSIDLICALSCSKDRNNFNPLITLTVQSFPDNLKDLSAEELVKSMGQNLKQASLPQGSNIIEYPNVIEAGSRKLMRYIITGIAQGKEMKTAYYSFVKEAKLYVLNGMTDSAMFDSYNKTFEYIAGNIEVE